jgi:hypothetical protein
MLADAFDHGKTYLPIEPDPRLAALSNPYSPAARSGLDIYDGNLTYFMGRYYMYWGAPPGAVLAVLRLVGVPPVGDREISFVAICLVFLFSAAILLRLKAIYYRQLPTWLLVLGLVLVGTIHPMLWLQSSGDLLSAAISSGQAFLIGGVFFELVSLTGEGRSPTGHIAAGLFWGLAIASRFTLATSVAVLLAAVAIFELRRTQTTGRGKIELVNLLYLLVTFGFVLCALGWYNATRFGNPIETGFRFTLTADDKNAMLSHGTLFSIRYILPNILNYALAPVRPLAHFPYFRAVYAPGFRTFNQLLPSFGVPSRYVVEDASGLVFAAPAILFAFVFFRKAIYGEIPFSMERDAASQEGAAFSGVKQAGLGLTLLLSGIAAALPILAFYFSVTRYQMDFVPLLAIVSVLGMWQAHQSARSFPIQSRIVPAAILLLVTTGTIISLCLALSGAASNLDDLNPVLYGFLTHFLPHW